VLKILPGARTRVVPNGVDADRFRQPPSELPHTYGPTIVGVGQVKARKGFHILAQAMKRIRQAVWNAQAVFIGDTSADPAYVSAIRAQLANDGLTDAVHFLGRVPEEVMIGWLHAADVFALPALNVGERFEGFGLVYLEASAAGLPVIGTRDNGAENAIWDGETGLLVPQDDPVALAEAATRLLCNPDLREHMGAAGRKLAAQHTWARAARQVVGVYNVALNRSP
jgi:phosphatidylinositol alpha-1,6-mannosyltransferase